MSDIDWSKAPEGATHYDPSCPCWYQQTDYQGWLYFDRGIWCVTVDKTGSWQNILTPRPVEWKSPQNGLPPVGTEVEAREFTYWVRGVVMAHVTAGDDEKRAIIQCAHGWFSRGPASIRPIKSERERAIEEMLNCFPDCALCIGRRQREVCAKLYDAGYRKETTPCSMK